MSWIEDPHAAPGTNPWSWEWGSPASFAGRRSCGCLRSQVCRCHQSRTSAPPAATAQDLSVPGLLVPTFLSGAQYPKARIQHGRAGNDILNRYYRTHGTFAGALVYIKPNISTDPAAAAHDDYYKPDTRWPTYTCTDQYPKARIDHGRAGDDILWRYFEKKATFSGAMVYIKRNGTKEPADDDPSSDDGTEWESYATVVAQLRVRIE